MACGGRTFLLFILSSVRFGSVFSSLLSLCWGSTKFPIEVYSRGSQHSTKRMETPQNAFLFWVPFCCKIRVCGHPKRREKTLCHCHLFATRVQDSILASGGAKKCHCRFGEESERCGGDSKGFCFGSLVRGYFIAPKSRRSRIEGVTVGQSIILVERVIFDDNSV